jgi:pimeloyl-ACP methyl ester carboxylesterase
LQITINGVKLNYHVSGEGKDLILLHGWGCSGQIFAPVHRHYERFFRTYSLDWPGFGESQEPPEDWGVADYARLFCAFLEELRIENPLIIAHSFGGRVAIYCAGALKMPFAKIVLTDSAGIKPRRGLDYYCKVYTYKLIKRIVTLPFLWPLFKEKFEAYRKKAGSADYQNASEQMKKVFVKVVNEDLTEYLPHIAASTLLIWGENDTATPLRDAKIMEKKIPDAGLVVFKNTGHYAFLENLPHFLAVVDSFFKNEMKK